MKNLVKSFIKYPFYANAIIVVLRQEAFNHKSLQAIEGRFPNGMTAMAIKPFSI